MEWGRGVLKVAATNLLITEPRSTTDRLVEAWRAAPPITQRAAIVAASASVIVAAGTSAMTSIRMGLIVTGLAFGAAAFVDLHERKLPNRLLGFALLAALVGVCATAHAGYAVDALIGMVVAGGSMLLVRLCRGVGMGDVKMAGVIGASVGPLTPIAAPFALAVAATIAGTYGAIARRSSLALGPALWFGWLLAVVVASPLGRWWS